MTGALDEIARIVNAESGIEISRLGMKSLEAAIAKIAPGLAAGDVLRSLEEPRGGASVRALLIEAVVVHETFFFRQQGDLHAIDWASLLALARAAGSERVRVWIAACATGEEAYTIGMLVSEAFGSRTPPVSILASDISSAALVRAEHAHYHGRALHAVEDQLLKRYFHADGDELAVNDAVRSLVTFRRHNLVKDRPPPGSGPFELILCRNALIYFGSITVEKVLRMLERALADGGALILSAADRLSGPAGPRSRQRREAGASRESPGAEWRQPRQPGPLVAPGREKDDWRSVAGGGGARRAAGRDPVDLAERLSEAIASADAGRLAESVLATAAILEEDPLHADALFIRGIAELGLGDAPAAIGTLRRALYVDPVFALAAFRLGGAYDACGDRQAARRAYALALRTLRPDDHRYLRLAGGVDAADVAAACRSRLAATAER